MKKISLIFALLVTFSASAQQEEMGTLIVTGLPRAIVRTHKVNEQPTTADTSISIPAMAYSNIPAQAKTSFAPEPIKPANITPKVMLPKLYRFYARAGIGNYTTPLIDFYFNDIYNKKGSYGAKFHHLSSQGGIKNVGFSGFADNDLGLYGKTFFKKFELGGSLDYKRNAIYYYGFNPDSFNYSKDTIKQAFNYVGASVNFGTYYPDSIKINHKEEMSYYFYNDIYGAQENYFGISSRMSKKVNKETFGLNASFNYNHFLPTFLFPGCASCLENKENGPSQQNVLITLNPNVISNGKNWNARVGLAIAMDVYDGTSSFHFYPDVEFKYSLFNDIFIPYVGLDGGKKRNSYRSITGENPFVLSNFELLNTNNKLNVYGGFQGTISSSLSFNTRVSFTKTENSVLYVTDTVYYPGSKFKVIYDDLDILTISGQLNWQKLEKIKLLARAEFFSYTTTYQPFAWSLPKFKITVGGVYDLYDKIIIRGDVFVTGKRIARSLDPTEGITAVEGVYPVELKPIVDVNLGVEYRYTKRISAFINFNNIAAKRYQYWFNYPVMGINILGGATFSF